MRLTWKIYSLAKSGNHPDENEDACYPSVPAVSDSKEFCCALSDGATSTSFSKKWANILAENSVKEFGSIQHDLKPIIQRSQTQWRHYVNDLELPWHAQEKSQQGAFSTLLWFKASQTGYSNKTLGRWQALAVGDTCFCHLRENKIQAAFPLQFSGQLNNNPYLLSSIEIRNEGLWKKNLVRKGQGALEGGDEFIFMTDALAAWFLKELEDGLAPMEGLRGIFEDNQAGMKKFEELLRRLRFSNAIKNDDSTLGYLKVFREEPHVQEKGWK